ncbi:uncharacterized protein [Littorina saxatilis]|uniref:Uncharacterized protein n=1 Tax=Littorina saxatilis TaxID=31220 RepID=A0AAN9B8S8_9CAEN
MDYAKILFAVAVLMIIFPEDSVGQYQCTFNKETKYCCACCKKDCCNKPKSCVTPAPFNTESGSSDTPLIIGCVTAGLAVVAVIVALCCCCTKKQPQDDVEYISSTTSYSSKPLPAYSVSTFHASGAPTGRPDFLAPSLY